MLKDNLDTISKNLEWRKNFRTNTLFSSQINYKKKREKETKGISRFLKETYKQDLPYELHFDASANKPVF